MFIRKREQLDLLIANVEKTIAAAERRAEMTDKEKFEGFKQKMIEENERKYGEEIREKYGDEEVDKSYRKLKNMTKEQYEEAERLSAELKNLLKQAFATGDPAGSLHKRLQTCIDNGCAVFGKVTAKKPMPACQNVC